MNRREIIVALASLPIAMSVTSAEASAPRLLLESGDLLLLESGDHLLLDGWVMPNVVGLSLTDAEDAINAITGGAAVVVRH